MVLSSTVCPSDVDVIEIHLLTNINLLFFFTVTCYQITVSGSGSAAPDTVSLPGAYAASDPGILINIYQSLSTYEAPGPTVYSGGSTKSAGAACANCEATCTAGSGSTGAATSGDAAATGSSAATSTLASSSYAAAATTTTAVSSSSAAATSNYATTNVAAAPTTSSSSYAASSATSSAASSAAPTAVKSCNKKRRNRVARHF